jgi:hypothetical protein
MTNPPKPSGPALELPADLKIVYSNLARIAHSPADIVIDFAHLLPGETRAAIGARIVMTPVSVKLLLRALSDNLARYESAFGEIKVPVNSSLAEHLFKPFQPPEDEKKGPDPTAV